MAAFSKLDEVKEGTSITEMEFLYGALERRGEKVNAWFYIMDNGVCDDRVTALRQQIKYTDKMTRRHD